MLRTPQFYMLWSVFIFSALAGLMVIYCIRLFGIDALTYSGVTDVGAVAGTAMAWYAIFNGLGRIFWGSISDKIGRKKSILAMTMLQGLAMLSVYHVFITYASSTGLIISASIIGFNFGGNFALIPAATADYFGNKNVGANYGYVFTAYGIAGILGPQLAGYFKDSAASGVEGWMSPSHWMAPFVIAGLSCFIAFAIIAFTKAPSPPQKVEEEDVILKRAS
jgi:MFS family permease